MFQIDPISHLLTVDVDMNISSLEKKLNDQGFTIGFFHPPENDFTLEEVLSKKIPNLYSLVYGEIEDLVVALSLQTDNEVNLQTKIAPRQATGPNWKNFLLGSERELGLIYQAVLKLFYSPDEIVYSLIGFSHFEESYFFERELTKLELIPRCFYRSEGSKLNKKFINFQNESMLILEWGGLQPMLGSMLARLKSFVEKKYPYEVIKDVAGKKYFSKIVREKMPEIKWGGRQFLSLDQENSSLKNDLLKIFR